MVPHTFVAFTILDVGLATATTSATYFPHCEQRIRVASAASNAMWLLRSCASQALLIRGTMVAGGRNREYPQEEGGAAPSGLRVSGGRI